MKRPWAQLSMQMMDLQLARRALVRPAIEKNDKASSVHMDGTYPYVYHCAHLDATIARSGCMLGRDFSPTSWKVRRMPQYF